MAVLVSMVVGGQLEAELQEEVGVCESEIQRIREDNGEKVLSWGGVGVKTHSLNREEMAIHPFRSSIEKKPLAGGVLLKDPIVSLD